MRLAQLAAFPACALAVVAAVMLLPHRARGLPVPYRADNATVNVDWLMQRTHVASLTRSPAAVYGLAKTFAKTVAADEYTVRATVRSAAAAGQACLIVDAGEAAPGLLTRCKPLRRKWRALPAVSFIARTEAPLDAHVSVSGDPAGFEVQNFTVTDLGPATVPPDTLVRRIRAREHDPAMTVFAFRSTWEDAAYGCSIDDGRYRTCKAGITLRNLSEGPHQIKVRSVDAAGVIDPTPAVETWMVKLGYTNGDFNSLAGWTPVASRFRLIDARRFRNRYVRVVRTAAGPYGLVGQPARLRRRVSVDVLAGTGTSRVCLTVGTASSCATLMRNARAWRTLTVSTRPGSAAIVVTARGGTAFLVDSAATR